jgi:hypothetical protein
VNISIPILFISILLLCSCDSEIIKTGADYKEITIAYGILDMGAEQGQQYIKITKGFFSETLNNLQVAKNEDSLYFKDLNVMVEEYNNGTYLNTFDCKKTDLSQLANPILKEDGIFLNSKNYAYGFRAVLDPKNDYKLVIKNNRSGSVVTSETPIISTRESDFRIKEPFSPPGILNFSNPYRTFKFSWDPPPFASVFGIVLKFHYDEINLLAGDTSRKVADLAFGSLIRRTSPTAATMAHIINNIDFYSLLSSSVGAAGKDIIRRVGKPELLFMAGDKTLEKYIEISRAKGGLTADQIKPFYTNLSRDGVLGDGVYGIFCSRGSRSLKPTDFSTSTYNAIFNSEYTRNLNFVGKSL